MTTPSPTVAVPVVGMQLGGAAPDGGDKLRPFASTDRVPADAILHFAALGSALIVLLMLVALVLVLFVAALPSVRRFGPKFLVTSDWRPNALPVLKINPKTNKPIRDPRSGMKVVDHYNPPVFGALASIYGTCVTALLAILMAVPFSFGTALYLVRRAPKRLVAPISFLVEFLAAIPSIAYGLWGMFVLGPWLAGSVRWAHPLRFIGWSSFALPVGGYESLLSSIMIHVPLLRSLFGRQVDGHWEAMTGSGRDLFVAGVVLAIMIVPIITAISRDVLKNVPRAQIEGTIALGGTWWQSCSEMLKFSRSALFGAVILGLARAAGETMAVLMVMGNTAALPLSPLLPGTTMSATLASEFPEAATNDLHRGALMEVALILLVMSLAFNIVARFLVVGKGSRGAAAH